MAGVYKSSAEHKLRIAFVHPDLGIGGAERLVVDAAVALQRKGHHVDIFTSYHDDSPDGRSFEETRNGTLSIHVLGGWLFPRSLFGKFTIVMAILRQLHLTASLLLASNLRVLSALPFLSLFVLSQDEPFLGSKDWSIRRQLPPYDVIIVDQLSTCIPLLRWLGGNRVVFYCHFPDLLLSPSTQSTHQAAGLLRSLYRAPIDHLEESTTGQADKILVNSEFTAQIFQKTFPMLRRLPRVVYPGIDVSAYSKPSQETGDHQWLHGNERAFLSINRFERKKDLALAIDAFALFKKARSSSTRLILAGGFDARLKDNINTVRSLQALARSLDLSVHTYSSTAEASVHATSTKPDEQPDVLILLNMSNEQKLYLLQSKRTSALLYTPSFEHLGIVPLEAMACGLPIIATKSGGPTETVVDNGLPGSMASTPASASETTGLLREPDASVWSEAMSQLDALSDDARSTISKAGLERARRLFSLEKMGDEFEKSCMDAAAIDRPIHSESGFARLILFLVFAFFAFLAAYVAVAYL